MKGFIISIKNDKGSIRSTEGQVYEFDESSFSEQFNSSDKVVDQSVEFDVLNDLATNIKTCEKILVEDETLYKEPLNVEVVDKIPEDYILIDKSEYTITKEANTEEIARTFLLKQCHDFGGNTIIDYKVESYLKNSIGVAFKLYKVTGRPAVIGKIDKKGDYNYADLKHQLNHNGLLNYHKDEILKVQGKKFTRIIAIVLCIIFGIGFFMSLK